MAKAAIGIANVEEQIPDAAVRVLLVWLCDKNVAFGLVV
jgi:hypothetical protein